MKVTNHHVVGRIQEDQRALISCDRRRKVHGAPLNLAAATWPLKADVEPAAVMDGEHFVDRIDLAPHVVVERADAV
ncbi:hypothetical protein D3C78_1524240 [compost metagenome]